jgi:hypothetical protein
MTTIFLAIERDLNGTDACRGSDLVLGHRPLHTESPRVRSLRDGPPRRLASSKGRDNPW